MSGVVLRCPNCGTTRATPGECEACHEAQVRHYCTHHTPGLWLDSSACRQCGARFGALDRPPAPPRPTPPKTPPAAPPAPRPRAPATARPRAGEAPEIKRRGRPPAVDAEATYRHPDREAGDERPEELRDAPVRHLPSWTDLLGASARTRRMPPLVAHDTDDLVPVARRTGGCLGRLVLLMVFLVLALMSGMFVLGGSVLRMFLPY